MKRRALLAATALTLSEGCLTSLTSTPNGSRPVADRKFTIYELDSDASERSPGPTEKPTVSFGLASKQVIVLGSLYVGLSQCNKAELKDVSCDADSETLTVRVGNGDKSHSGNSCTADESADAYRLVVTMKEQLPKTVRVEQVGDPSAKSVTVQRS
ncbi:hypothetical protein ACFFQF_05775 [Haladaptatus pallidirubidus]|uniref:Secreted protein n=1 Tax=Haladaptatus pallidirubidus TaxID=1008152 RepID=A0AAV3UMC7_9EURY|nr:hypothetical protein [Haladaptatus pallidirubidus]